MLPVQILDLLFGHAGELLLDVAALAPLVVPLHPEQRGSGDEQNGAGDRQVEAVADMVVRAIVGQVAPGRDETANVASHNCIFVSTLSGIV